MFAVTLDAVAAIWMVVYVVPFFFDHATRELVDTIIIILIVVRLFHRSRGNEE